MIDRKKAIQTFNSYACHYDSENLLIKSKIVHTFHVADNCDRIARSLKFTEPARDFAWLLGLLHDIGRFEQVKRYGTFFDLYSVDHAELGADILFQEQLIEMFWFTEFPDTWRAVCETAIRTHNKLTIPAGLDAETKQFSELLRDADKADILRVINEIPFEERVGSSKKEFHEAEQASDEVMNCVYAHQCLPRNLVHTKFEGHISHCCLGFELVYDCTKEIVKEQGYLDALLQESDSSGKQIWNDAETKQLAILRTELKNALTQRNDL